MRANPVLLKEVRQRFRTVRTPLILSLYLLVIGGLCLAFIFLQWRDMPGYYQPGMSKGLFIMLSMIQLGLLAFVTPGLTSGAISAEREKQTLSVLLVTRLKPHSIVLGKLMSSCSFMVLILLATLPLYNIIFMYGGFSPGQMLAVFAFYLFNIFLFASVGMACSSFFRRTGASTVAAYVVIFVIMAGTVLLSAFIYEVTRVPGAANVLPVPCQILLDLNPPQTMIRLMGEGVLFGRERDLWAPGWLIYTAFYALLSGLLLWWSSLRLRPGVSAKSTWRQ
ncbi:MAG: ABC transporter permease [Bacillota bacterium]